MCQSKSYQLHNNVETTCMTSPEHIEEMELRTGGKAQKLESYSRPMYRMTRIIVNDFESENLYVLNFINKQNIIQ